MKLIDKDALVAEIENRRDGFYSLSKSCEKGTPAKAGFYAQAQTLEGILSFLGTIEVKEVDKVWHVVDNVNLPQPDKNKIYCVLSMNKYLLAKVINHPHDELLQWKCTEFPFHRYDICEGDKYMQIV